jgi:hypothetical protein
LPTARQTAALGQLTLFRTAGGAGIPDDHWTPPFFVKKAPPEPTATHSVRLAQLRALRSVDGLGETWAVQVAPPSVVA